MTIEPQRLAQLALFTAMLAAGQLMFKGVALRAAAISDLGSAAQLLRQPFFWLAVAIYGLATVLWVYLLQRMSLAVAYAFVAIVFIFVPVGAWFFFGERLTLSYAVGSTLIIAGVFVIGASAA